MRIAQYEIIKERGRGGFATVYKARDTKLDRIVALKVLHPYWSEDPNFVARFQREARSAANLRHPNIVTVYDASEAAGQLYIVMEYLPGRTLRELLEAEGALPLERALPILEQIASALDYAHGQRVIHRDVKPANVIVEETPGGVQATLMDFGLVKAMEGSAALTSMGTLLGSPEYMAPEQADPNRAAEVGPAADRYALGVVAYQMLAGRVPFPGNTPATLNAHLNMTPPDPHSIREDLVPDVAAALLKMLAKSPADRFASASVFVAQLREALLADNQKRQREAQLAPLYERVKAAITQEDWAEVLTLGGQIQTLDAGYRDVREMMACARKGMRRPPRRPSPGAKAEGKPRKLAPTWVWIAGGAVLVVAVVAIVIWSLLRFPVDLARATPSSDKDSTINLSTKATTLEVDYDLGTGGWVQVTIPINRDLSFLQARGAYISFSLKGVGDANSFEVKLEDADGSSYGWLSRPGASVTDEKRIWVPLDALKYRWGGDVTMNWQQVKNLQFAVSLKQGDKRGKGKVIVRDVVITLIPNLQPASSDIRIRRADGMMMVYVPSGNFLMGSSSNDPNAQDDEKPQYSVYLDAFWIDATEVTNAQYNNCVQGQVCKPSSKAGDSQLNGDNQPVVGVAWDDAVTYCRWAGAALPTEAQWEKTARGSDGRIYPWGNQTATCDYAVLNEGKGDGCGNGDAAWPVGSRPKGASPFGALDMAGNAGEWVESWYDGYPGTTYKSGQFDKTYKVLRGGHLHSGQADVRAAYRGTYLPYTRNSLIGFRCVAAKP